jgi:hypothetical protein
MSDYTQATSFGPKDSLTTGDPNKKIRGTQLDTELSAISSAIQSKYDSSDIASDTEAAALASDTKLITPDKLKHALENGTFTLSADASVEGTDTFPNVSGPVTATQAELNILDGATIATSDLNKLAKLESGNYTPTVTALGNCSIDIIGNCMYSRVGDIVTISGEAAVTILATGTAQFSVSLPIASNLINNNPGYGVATTVTGFGRLIGSQSNDNLVVNLNQHSSSTNTVFWIAQYPVL